MMIPRRLGQDITKDTRAESNETTDRLVRRQRIIEILDEMGAMTAKEIAVELHNRGITDNDDRNNAAPRLTELCQEGIVEPIGKRACRWTGKTVAVYARRVINRQECMF